MSTFPNVETVLANIHTLTSQFLEQKEQRREQSLAQTGALIGQISREMDTAVELQTQRRLNFNEPEEDTIVVWGGRGEHSSDDDVPPLVPNDEVYEGPITFERMDTPLDYSTRALDVVGYMSDDDDVPPLDPNDAEIVDLPPLSPFEWDESDTPLFHRCHLDSNIKYTFLDDEKDDDDKTKEDQDRDFECVICHQIARLPSYHNCGKLFCKICVRKWRETTEIKRCRDAGINMHDPAYDMEDHILDAPCPFCREKAAKYKPADGYTKKMTEKIMTVRCETCKEEMKLGKWNTHWEKHFKRYKKFKVGDDVEFKGEEDGASVWLIGVVEEVMRTEVEYEIIVKGVDIGYCVDYFDVFPLYTHTPRPDVDYTGLAETLDHDSHEIDYECISGMFKQELVKWSMSAQNINDTDTDSMLMDQLTTGVLRVQTMVRPAGPVTYTMNGQPPWSDPYAHFNIIREQRRVDTVRNRLLQEYQIISTMPIVREALRLHNGNVTNAMRMLVPVGHPRRDILIQEQRGDSLIGDYVEYKYVFDNTKPDEFKTYNARVVARGAWLFDCRICIATKLPNQKDMFTEMVVNQSLLSPRARIDNIYIRGHLDSCTCHACVLDNAHFPHCSDECDRCSAFMLLEKKLKQRYSHPNDCECNQCV